MKISDFRSSVIRDSKRLDAAYFLSSGELAKQKLSSLRASGTQFQKLGGNGGIATIWQPNRFKRVYATNKEESLPYLRPYDVFSYIPLTVDHLSVTRNRGIEKYKLRSGMLLQSCSGRNLGPAIAVDSELEKFLIGDDMLRIEIGNENLRWYVLAYLRSRLGQALLRQGKTGSVIDHISQDHVSSIDVPMFPEHEIAKISESMHQGWRVRERSRSVIQSSQEAFNAIIHGVDVPSAYQTWQVQAKDVQQRLDAAPYHPDVIGAASRLRKLGGRPLRDHARVYKPPGRYKTNYVAPLYGVPLLSGTQLLQHLPVNLKYMAPSFTANLEQYKLKKGQIAYQADGRAEETLGWPVVITQDREDWLASGHVGRIVPFPGVSLGWLYAALRSPEVQIQIKARASGSVVDATFPADYEDIVLPPFVNDVAWQQVEEAWFNFAVAAESEAKAVNRVDTLAGMSWAN